MSTWSDGYVADVGYTYGYYKELNPLRIKLAFTNAGLSYPEIGSACELGFGQGLSINAHAAASVSRWYGTDFNPSQVVFAQYLAASFENSPQLFDQAFLDFCQRPDLPDFDFIALHGVWSWISDESREIIIDFIHRKLKVGGVLYVSYNTLPGWSSNAPLRELLIQHSNHQSASGENRAHRIDSALNFASQLVQTQPLYTRVNTHAERKLEQLKTQDRSYLAHEFFNRDWVPMYFSNMAEHLETAKLSYAVSANFADMVDAINLNTEQQKFLTSIPHPTFKQTVRDFMVNQQFRKDYWVRGAQQLTPLQQAEELRALRVVLVAPKENIPLKVSGPLGEINLLPDVYLPILDILCDHAAKSLQELEQALSPRGLPFLHILQACLILISEGHLEPAHDQRTVDMAKHQTQRLNAQLMKRAQGIGDIPYLISPVTGGAVVVSRFHQLFGQLYASGVQDVDTWISHVWKLLDLQGQKIVKQGMTMESAEENIAELKIIAADFQAKVLPMLNALCIV